MKVFLYSATSFFAYWCWDSQFFWDAADMSWRNEKKLERPPKHSLQPTLLGRQGAEGSLLDIE